MTTRRGHMSVSPSKIKPSVRRSRMGTGVLPIINWTTKPSFINSIAFLPGDPIADLFFQNAEWQRTVIEYGVMKLPEVEFAAQLCFRFASQLFNLQFAKFICERLSKPHDVAIDFDGDVIFSLDCVFEHEVDRLLTTPTERVYASVDYQSACAPHFVS